MLEGTSAPIRPCSTTPSALNRHRREERNPQRRSIGLRDLREQRWHTALTLALVRHDHRPRLLERNRSGEVRPTAVQNIGHHALFLWQRRYGRGPITAQLLPSPRPFVRPAGWHPQSHPDARRGPDRPIDASASRLVKARVTAHLGELAPESRQAALPSRASGRLAAALQLSPAPLRQHRGRPGDLCRRRPRPPLDTAREGRSRPHPRVHSRPGGPHPRHQARTIGRGGVSWSIVFRV